MYLNVENGRFLYNCIDEIQNGPLPLLKKIEFIKNSETLWTKVLKKLITLLKISLKILKKLIKYTDVLQIKSKPHITLLPKGRLRGRGFETAFFPKMKMFFSY